MSFQHTSNDKLNPVCRISGNLVSYRVPFPKDLGEFLHIPPICMVVTSSTVCSTGPPVWTPQSWETYPPQALVSHSNLSNEGSFPEAATLSSPLCTLSLWDSIHSHRLKYHLFPGSLQTYITTADFCLKLQTFVSYCLLVIFN